VAFTVEDGGFALNADFPRQDLDAGNWLSPQENVPDLASLLPPDAFMALRFEGNPTLAQPLFSAVAGPHVAGLIQSAGIDVQKDVLRNMEPGAVASLSLSPLARLGGGVPTLDVRQTNPFGYVQLVAVSKVRDEAQADAALAKLPTVAPRLGMAVKPMAVGGRTTYLTSYARGEGVSVAREGKHVVLGAPLARVAETMQRLETPAARAPSAVAQALPRAPLGLLVDLTKLSDEVRALPSEAWGVGGFAIKATALRWVDMLSDLKTVQVMVTSQKDATQLSARLQVVFP
jgi:hypothetical protein